MFEKTLPITITPNVGECLTSFLMRSAAVYGVSTDQLIQHCLHGHGQGAHARVLADDLAINPDSDVLVTLSRFLRVPPDDLQAMTMVEQFASISPHTIAFTGAARDLETGDNTPSRRLRFGWCPLCLMEDRAGGGDHFLRLEWPLAFATMCAVHKRPLIERCQKCYCFVTKPDYALYRDQMALVCPNCFTPLDARLGYDFVTNQHARDWNADTELHAIWHKIIDYERILLNVLRGRSGQSKKQRIGTEVLGLLNILLSAEKPNDPRPVDVLDSAYFPSPAKLGLATRHLKQPFHICHLVERSKALAIMICLFDDTSDAFGFETGAPPMNRFRDLMSRATYYRFERHFLNIAKLALPV